MRKEKIPHQAPFAIQAAQLLGRAIGAGPLRNYASWRKGDVLQGD
jgi:hypothetical protein